MDQQQAQQQDQPQVPLGPQVEEGAGIEKKAKMKDFDDAVTVGNYIALRPAQYALC